MNELVLPVPKQSSTRNLATLSREAMPPGACCLRLYIWIRGVNNWKSNQHTCKEFIQLETCNLHQEKKNVSGAMDCHGPPRARDPLWVLAVEQPDSRQTYVFAFLVNFVIIGENICQHTLTEHNCSI